MVVMTTYSWTATIGAEERKPWRKRIRPASLFRLAWSTTVLVEHDIKISWQYLVEGKKGGGREGGREERKGEREGGSRRNADYPPTQDQMFKFISNYYSILE